MRLTCPLNTTLFCTSSCRALNYRGNVPATQLCCVLASLLHSVSLVDLRRAMDAELSWPDTGHDALHSSFDRTPTVTNTVNRATAMLSYSYRHRICWRCFRPFRHRICRGPRCRHTVAAPSAAARGERCHASRSCGRAARAKQPGRDCTQLMEARDWEPIPPRAFHMTDRAAQNMPTAPQATKDTNTHVQPPSEIRQAWCVCRPHQDSCTLPSDRRVHNVLSSSLTPACMLAGQGTHMLRKEVGAAVAAAPFFLVGCRL